LPETQFGARRECAKSVAFAERDMRKRDLMELYRDWLRLGLRQPGKTGRGLAAFLGLDPAAVSRMVAGERQIKADEIPRMAEYLGLPPPGGVFSTSKVRVIGIIAAGIWREPETMISPSEHEIPVLDDSSEQEKYALQVADASISPVIPKGAFAICVPYWNHRQELHDGDLVHIERKKGNLVETTVRKLIRNSHGFQLVPESDQPGYAPIPYAGRHDEHTEIKGLVIGSYRAL
jgi:SOS-response transcriptional repressor LexA